MKRNLILSAVVGVSMLATGHAFAYSSMNQQNQNQNQNKMMVDQQMQHRGMYRDMRYAEDLPNVQRFQHAVQKLNLTPDQRQQIRGVFASAGPQFRQYWEQMRANRYQIRQVIMSGGNNQSQLNRLARQQGQVFTQALNLKLRTINQVVAVLSPEQRAKLQAMRESFRHKHHRHYHNQ